MNVIIIISNFVFESGLLFLQEIQAGTRKSLGFDVMLTSRLIARLEFVHTCVLENSIMKRDPASWLPR